MNTYIVPVCDIDNGLINNYKFCARSYSECEEKLINKLCNEYEELPDNLNYSEFVEEADEHNILIGKITDIEEI